MRTIASLIVVLFFMFCSSLALSQAQQGGMANVDRLGQMSRGPRVDINGNIYQRTSPTTGFINGRVYVRSASGTLTPSGFIHDRDPSRRYSAYAYTNRFAGGPTIWEERDAQMQLEWELMRRRSAQMSRSNLPPQYRRHPVYGW